MKKILETPYYYWHEYLPKSLCEAIIEEGDKLRIDQAGMKDENTIDKEARETKVGFFPRQHWVESIVANVVQMSNAQAKWNFALDSAEAVQYGIYNEGAYYKWHRDDDHLISYNRKLSITVQLSDPTHYSGGDFKMCNFYNEELPYDPKLRGQGTIIVFPSLLRHTVEKVTRGTRKSLVQWYSGPAWQ